MTSVQGIFKINVTKKKVQVQEIKMDLNTINSTNI